MPTSGGLQFLPQNRQRFHVASIPGSSGFLWFSIIVLLGVAGVYGVVWHGTGSAEGRIAGIDAELESIQKGRDRAVETKLLNFSQQLATTRTLLASHITWSSAIYELQRTIEPKVRFISLEADTVQKHFSFRASADSYATVAKQLAALYHSPAVKDLALTRVQATNSGGVEFTVDVTLNTNAVVQKSQ